MPRRR
jgi:hypothetical protein